MTITATNIIKEDTQTDTIIMVNSLLFDVLSLFNNFSVIFFVTSVKLLTSRTKKYNLVKT